MDEWICLEVRYDILTRSVVLQNWKQKTQAIEIANDYRSLYESFMRQTENETGADGKWLRKLQCKRRGRRRV